MLQQFYDTVLPSEGAYALFDIPNKRHVWTDSIAELVRWTESLIEKQGIYFATAAFNSAAGGRKQDNVAALRALRLDIDAGEKKFAMHPDGAYPSQREAVQGLMAFITATGVMPTYIVNSGEGLHVYYALTEDVPPAVWMPLAKRLGEHAKASGLKVDPTVTLDTARVLRPPGTLHKNGSRVSILKDTGKLYGVREIYDLLGAIAEPEFPSAGRKYDTSINDDMLAVVGPPKTIHKIIAACPAMQEVAAARGDVQEPLWRAMIGITKFTIEGEDAAQQLSDGYDGYDPDEVTAKYEAWHTGPTTCAQFGLHTKACLACPHRGKIKSPIQLGLMTTEQIQALPDEKQEELTAAAAPVVNDSGKPWEGKLPDKFYVQQVKGHDVLVQQIIVEKEGADGEKTPMLVNVPFSYDIFWLGTWAESAGNGDTSQVFVHRYDAQTHRVKVLTMEQGLVATRVEMFKWLGQQSIHHTTHKKAAQAMEDYIRNSLEQIKRMGRRPKINERFGVRILDNGQLASAHGSKLILADGRIQEGVLEEKLRNAATLFELPLKDDGTGDWGPEVWDDVITPRARRYAAFMKASYGVPGAEKFALAAMLALVSPLMPFVTGSYQRGLALPPNGLSVSLVSRFGGKGKSGLAQAVMLAYGSPTLAKDGGQNGATDLARISKLSMWGTMPLSLEEMGNTKEQSVANLISSIANGSGRERSTRTGGLTSSATWSLIALITTNRAQRDMVAATTEESSAIQYRLLELNVEGVEFSPAQVAAYELAWSDVQRDCAGAMGAVIERAICSKGVEVLNREVLAMVRRASEMLDAKQDARFQYRALGAVMYMQLLLKELGLDMFDLSSLVASFREAHAAGIGYVAENILPTDGVSLLSMCLSDLRSGTLITEGEAGGSDRQFDVVLNQRAPDDVAARHIKSQQVTWLSSAALRQWAHEKKVSERDLLRDCKKAGVFKLPDRNDRGRWTTHLDLFKGTRDAGASRTSVFIIDVKKLNTLNGTDVAADETLLIKEAA